MRVLNQGTYSANCVCDCGHHYIFMDMLPSDQSKCPCCMNPDVFKDDKPVVIDCELIKLHPDEIANMKLPACTKHEFINEGKPWKGYEVTK